MNLNLDMQSSIVFERNFDTKKRVVVNRGGTRSTKSYSLAQLAILFLFTGYVSPDVTLAKGVWTTVRKFSVTLDATIIRDFEAVIDQHELRDFINHNKTKKTYAFGDRIIEFIGVDNEQKVRGAKREVLHCNEGNELTLDEFKQLMRRTTHRAYIDFNPDDDEVWINTQLEQRRQFEKGDVEVIVSTYLDNPFLEPELKAEIEYEKIVDPESWEVYGLGNYGKRRGLIFTNWSIVEAIPEGATLIGHGLDFGFTNDPTAMVSVYKLSGELWIDERIYQHGLTNQDISNRFTELGIGRTQTIIADSAEPKSIAEIYSNRFNIQGAKKGKDSITNSIDILRRHKLNVTAASVNLIRELKRYKYKVDKNGVTLNEPVGVHDHAISALRYLAINMIALNTRGRYAIG